MSDGDGTEPESPFDAAEGAISAARVEAGEAGETVYDKLQQWFLAGAALLVPLVVTVFILAFVLNFISNALDPLVGAVRYLGLSAQAEDVVIEASAILTLLVVVVVVGFVADVTERNYATSFHTAIEVIPGVGGLYRSFRRMSDAFVESNTDSFEEVKLVEFPHEGAYSLAFLTADTPDVIQDAAGELAMQTLFLPLAPNPVMGGFIVHLPADRIYDVDMTVETAIQAIVTSGVSVEAPTSTDDRGGALSMDELGDLGTARAVDEQFDSDDGVADDHNP